MHLKLFFLKKETAIQKIPETKGHLICKKVTNKITTVSKTSPQNSLETVANEAENIGLDREIPRERYTSSQKRQKIIDD